MKNKELKKELLSIGTYKEFSSKRGKMLHSFNYDQEQVAEELKETYGTNYNALEQLRRAKKEQRKKIKKHYQFWTHKHYRIVFATFTISEECRNEMSKNKNYFNNFKKSVIRSFYPFVDDYILNIDYGTLNEREHFHALLAFNRYNETRITKSEEHLGQVEIDDIKEKYHLGFTTFKLCGNEEEDSKKLSSYMDKLVSHSIKVKQTYISVKKGSEYQQHQALLCKVKPNYVEGRRTLHSRAQQKAIYDNYKMEKLLSLFNGKITIIDHSNVLNIAPYQVRGKNQVIPSIERSKE